MEDKPELHVIPTELDRQDVYYDFAALATGVLIVWWMILNGLGPWGSIAVVLIGVWVLTGEAAGDVEHVGALAAGLRSKFGLRRAHEWVLALAHFWHLAVWPVWRDFCVACWRSCLRTTTGWLGRASASIRWNLSRASSWGFRIRSRLSGALGR